MVPVPEGANVSWEPGFDGGYLQRFSIWYTPLCVACPSTSLLPTLLLSGPLAFLLPLHSSPAPTLLPDFQRILSDLGWLKGGERLALQTPSFLFFLVLQVPPFPHVLQGKAS